MAGVAKWLRPRIVVPIFVGSNPITRPIYKKTSIEVFFNVYISTQNEIQNTIYGKIDKRIVENV